MPSTPYSVTPPGEYQTDATLLTVAEQIPDFGSFTNLAAGANMFYGAINNNLQDLNSLFQRQFDWEIKKQEKTRAEERERTMNEVRASELLTIRKELTDLRKILANQAPDPGKFQNPDDPTIEEQLP